MNSYEIPYESFIGGWFISENICDKVISYFESKSDNHFKGNVGGKEYDKDFLDTKEKICVIEIQDEINEFLNYHTFIFELEKYKNMILQI